jgi:hypothetical protein
MMNWAISYPRHEFIPVLLLLASTKGDTVLTPWNPSPAWEASNRNLRHIGRLCRDKALFGRLRYFSEFWIDDEEDCGKNTEEQTAKGE